MNSSGILTFWGIHEEVSASILIFDLLGPNLRHEGGKYYHFLPAFFPYIFLKKKKIRWTLSSGSPWWECTDLLQRADRIISLVLLGRVREWWGMIWR